MMNFLLLAQNFDDGGAGGAGAAAGGMMGLLCNCVLLILALIPLIGLWKVFEKAGKPGWAAIVPIYNAIVLLEIVGRPLWWIILFFVPCVNFIVSIMIALDMAKCFGKGAGFGIGLAFLPFIFYPLLGFSDAKYMGPQASS